MNATVSQGKIVQIIGAVVDVEFPRSEVPKVYDALKVQGTEITLEVQQQLGDGIVRTIALGSTDGLKRNLVAENTGEGIKVPVGVETLGRIIAVLTEAAGELAGAGDYQALKAALLPAVLDSFARQREAADLARPPARARPDLFARAAHRAISMRLSAQITSTDRITMISTAIAAV